MIISSIACLSNPTTLSTLKMSIAQSLLHTLITTYIIMRIFYHNHLNMYFFLSLGTVYTNTQYLCQSSPSIQISNFMRTYHMQFTYPGVPNTFLIIALNGIRVFMWYCQEQSKCVWLPPTSPRIFCLYLIWLHNCRLSASSTD